MEINGKIRIGITSGLRGMFPIMYDDDGPISTGMTAKNHTQVKIFAIEWAKVEFRDKWKDHCDFISPGEENITEVDFL